MFLKLMTDYGSCGRDQCHVACLYASYTTSACMCAHKRRNVHNSYLYYVGR